MRSAPAKPRMKQMNSTYDGNFALRMASNTVSRSVEETMMALAGPCGPEHRAFTQKVMAIWKIMLPTKPLRNVGRSNCWMGSSPVQRNKPTKSPMKLLMNRGPLDSKSLGKPIPYYSSFKYFMWIFPVVKNTGVSKPKRTGIHEGSDLSWVKAESDSTIWFYWAALLTAPC